MSDRDPSVPHGSPSDAITDSDPVGPEFSPEQLERINNNIAKVPGLVGSFVDDEQSLLPDTLGRDLAGLAIQSSRVDGVRYYGRMLASRISEETLKKDGSEAAGIVLAEISQYLHDTDDRDRYFAETMANPEEAAKLKKEAFDEADEASTHAYSHGARTALYYAYNLLQSALDPDQVLGDGEPEGSAERIKTITEQITAEVAEREQVASIVDAYIADSRIVDESASAEPVDDTLKPRLVGKTQRRGQLSAELWELLHPRENVDRANYYPGTELAEAVMAVIDENEADIEADESGVAKRITDGNHFMDQQAVGDQIAAFAGEREALFELRKAIIETVAERAEEHSSDPETLPADPATIEDVINRFRDTFTGKDGESSETEEDRSFTDRVDRIAQGLADSMRNYADAVARANPGMGQREISIMLSGNFNYRRSTQEKEIARIDEALKKSTTNHPNESLSEDRRVAVAELEMIKDAQTMLDSLHKRLTDQEARTVT